MAVLIDTSAFLAYFYANDKYNRAVVQLMLSLEDETPIVALPVLTELFYLTTVRMNYLRAVKTFSAVRTGFQIELLIEPDLARMDEIMTQYSDARLDFTDVAIMALSERLKITRIASFDPEDFRIFRPVHCDYLEILP